jgi:hypothetical protein
MKAAMSREDYEKTFNINGQEIEFSNAGKHLIIFNDKSYSMEGKSFEDLKEACLSIAETLFMGADGEAYFEKTTVYFYGSNASDYKENLNFESYTNYIKNAVADSSTNFGACFEQICMQMDKANDGD